MPRHKGQRGWVEKIGPQWVGKYYRYEKQPDGTEKRLGPQEARLGPHAKMTKRQAQDKLQNFILAKFGLSRGLTVETTVGDAWHNYVNLKASWAGKTRILLEGIFTKHVLPKLGTVVLPDLTRSRVQSVLNAIAKDGLSYSLLQKVRTHLRAALEYAVDDGAIRVNPARKIEIAVRDTADKPTLTLVQIQRLLGLASERDALILELLLVCGLRRGEAFALRRDDVLPGQLKIDESVDEKGTTGATKTEASRALVRLPQELEAKLRRWMEQQTGREETAWLFPAKDASRPIDPHNYLNRVLRPLGDEAGLQEPLTFQLLRRTCATLLQQHGGVKDIQAHLRHTSPKTTAKVYMQAIPERTKNAVDALASEISRHKS